MHGRMPGSHSLWDARSPLGFSFPDAPPLLSKPALPGSSRAKCFFMPYPGAPRAITYNANSCRIKCRCGFACISTACCIYCELTGQGLPLADLICAIKPAEGSLASKVPVCIRGRVVKGQTVFFLACHLLHVHLPPWVPLSTP